jgi:hypothetical protein
MLSSRRCRYDNTRERCIVTGEHPIVTGNVFVYAIADRHLALWLEDHAPL